jgi:hypothetical protein
MDVSKLGLSKYPSHGNENGILSHSAETSSGLGNLHQSIYLIARGGTCIAGSPILLASGQETN